VPRVSVIVPAHNAALFLGAAIESVRAQSYGDWELIVVDDGSSDGTWELLQGAGADVRSYRRGMAGGPAVARNLAIEHATGELVTFLDADDLLLPRFLESQLARYEGARRERGAQVGLVTCDARILIDGEYAPYTYMQLLPDRGAPIVLDRVLRRNPIYGASIVAAEVGEEVGWFDPELFGTEDFGLWIKILETGRRAVLNDETLAVYRRTPGTVSSNIASQGRNNRRAYELALARGRLNARQRRIARRAVRYNRAMEQVALLRFASPAPGHPRRPSRLRALPRLRSLPLLAWVALANPRRWPEWLALLRSGRAKDAAELRARP
jgi:glycosyltransferase involved in cell wall biosynthesis